MCTSDLVRRARHGEASSHGIPKRICERPCYLTFRCTSREPKTTPPTTEDSLIYSWYITMRKFQLSFLQASRLGLRIGPFPQLLVLVGAENYTENLLERTRSLDHPKVIRRVPLQLWKDPLQLQCCQPGGAGQSAASSQLVHCAGRVLRPEAV